MMATSTSSLLESLLTVLVINTSFFGVLEGLIGVDYLLECLLGFLFVSLVFIGVVFDG